MMEMKDIIKQVKKNKMKTLEDVEKIYELLRWHKDMIIRQPGEHIRGLVDMLAKKFSKFVSESPEMYAGSPAVIFIDLMIVWLSLRTRTLKYVDDIVRASRSFHIRVVGQALGSSDYADLLPYAGLLLEIILRNTKPEYVDTIIGELGAENIGKLLRVPSRKILDTIGWS